MIGPLSFVDVDLDGNIDFLYTFQSSSGSGIAIHYNLQKALCASPSSSNCRATSALCSRDSGFKFDDFPTSLKSTGAVVIALLRDSRFNGWQLQDISSTLNDRSRNALRHGDIDNNGEPEFLISMIHPKGKVYAVMLTAVDCNGHWCGDSATAAGRKTITIIDNRILSGIQTSSGVESAAFFDLNEDGTHDVAMADGSNEPIKFFLNYLNEDAFFFKTLVENGVCPSWCSGDIKFPNPKVRSTLFHCVYMPYS